jgi:hypothetical protein
VRLHQTNCQILGGRRNQKKKFGGPENNMPWCFNCTELFRPRQAKSFCLFETASTIRDLVVHTLEPTERIFPWSGQLWVERKYEGHMEMLCPYTSSLQPCLGQWREKESFVWVKLTARFSAEQDQPGRDLVDQKWPRETVRGNELVLSKFWVCGELSVSFASPGSVSSIGNTFFRIAI